MHHAIAIVAFERISPFHLSAPCVVFGDRHPGVPPFDFAVCATQPGRLATTAGFSIVVEHGLEKLLTADTIIVPSWRDPAERAPADLLAALVAAHERGARIVGLCLGAYVLAQAGLLDGRAATTHWAYAEDFARRHPGVRLQPDVLYLEDGRMLTSAGTVAAIDCCLYMLRQQLGGEIANSVARRLVVPPHRQGGQAQFVTQPLPANATDARLSGLLDWVRAHLDQAHTLDSLAARATMSRRTFTRHFRQMTGATVGAWLLGERLALAQRLLESSSHSVETVSNLAGFGSAVSLRQHFRTAFGVSPVAWRRTFRDD
ncbi:helix-turn-helix domain-containing protein [Dechloromonas sp. CZR5]|uniref:helix-turn-helix domain-containing protein n=1 Tax=Dechloromonas sp. CZR5 TaxID=2608630 RepID=UPI00123D544A|nr:helix-turn-helix domain-containing protein [Dechloromonas sp. CZR5]